MITDLRSPYIIRMTPEGIDARLDCGSVNGADHSEEIAKLLGYPVLYRGVILNATEYKSVFDGVRYANESRNVGRFDLKVLEEILPNLKTKPLVVR